MFEKIDVNQFENNRNKIHPGGNAAFGCSFTYGTGVNHSDTWPAILNLYNCGQPGGSNDLIVRRAVEYCETYNPECIFIMWTFASRYEWVDEDNNYLRWKNTNTSFKWENALLELHNENFMKYNQTKNKILITNYCKANKIGLYCANINTFDHTTMPLGSDNSHPGKEWHACIAEYFETKTMVEQSP